MSATRPRLLDLFCGAGGAAMGYHRAGFDVLGVDIEPQPRYPFEFVQADAMTYPLDGFDAYAASPPCQDHIRGGSHSPHGTGWMLAATRERLAAQPSPWVIENVPGAPMRADLKLCGCMFGLRIPAGMLARERWFETSWHAFEMRTTCHHDAPVLSVVGEGTPQHVRAKLGRIMTADERRALMGTPWMTRAETSQAIPPAYTEHIGRMLMDTLSTAA
jgi:DNA (cytosine-5)-methyltransferase 1